MDILGSARLSVYRAIRDTFEGGINNTYYHVYTEDDLRLATVPVRPFVYLLDYGVFYETRHLPVTLVQCELESNALELGSDDCYLVNVALHVVGSNRAERDDLISYLMRYIKEIRLYNYMARPETYVGPVQLEEDDRGREWSVLDTSSMPIELVREGSLANWQPITTRFLLTSVNSWPMA